MSTVQTKKIIGGVRTLVTTVRPDGPDPIIFLHGFRGNHRGLLRLAELLGPRQVILPDLPGWGETDPFAQPHDFPAYLRWLAEFLTGLGHEKIDLGGHSYGASMALLFAADYPEFLKRLILIEPVVAATTFSSRLGRWYYQVAEHLPGAVQRRWILSPLLNRLTTHLMMTTRDAALRRKIIADEQANLPYIRIRVELEAYRSFYSTDFLTAAHRVKTPTIFLAGSRDQMSTVQSQAQLATTLPRCRCVTLPGAGHFAPMEVPEMLAEQLAAIDISA